MWGVGLVVAYDGTPFGGWQRQNNAPTVQAELERAVETMAGAACKVRGVSRTDAGVHAHHQVASFDSPRDIEPYKWARGLNGQLPKTIAVHRVARVPEGWDPRGHVAGKTYRYLLRVGDHRDPLMLDRAWQLGPRRTRPRPEAGRAAPSDWLDLDAMEAAAKHLEGTHDFQAFRSARDERENTVRTLREVRVVRGFSGRDDVVAVEVSGNAFMHNMVRILVGTLVEVGRERLDPDNVPALLGPDADRADCGETAPAHGLYLVHVQIDWP